MNALRASSLQSLQESDRSNESLLAESLQLDVEDLDDTEYAIPRVSELPTLEAVLSSEYELDSDIGSELNMPVPAPTPTPSIAEDGGVRVGGSGGGGSIMRYAMLQGVSAQVASAADRINAGLATACVVAAQIAIGTSHGHILNFDITQTLRWAYQEKNGQGAVTTLAFNPEGMRLLAGYARGLVQMLDTQSGDVLRSLNDVITPNTGILHVKWTSRPALALCADSGGSVWSLSFTRKLGIRSCSSRCLFSGARGEVCAIEPLIMDGSGASGTELDQYCIVALATLSKYFIVTIRPRLKVVKYHALNGPADCLPVLAWQMVLIQAADNTRSVDPVIVVGRGQQLYFHQLFVANGRISLLYLRYVQLQANLLSAHWLGPKHVTCMDTTEILHLIDVRTCKELECFDMANAGLVYGSAQFKGLATGGNVSPALALAGTHACYNSMSSRGTQLYILGARSLHMIGVRNWNDRISYLVKNQRWQEACDLALEGYRAASSSMATRPKRKIQAKERIILLFREYLAASARAPDYCLAAIVKCMISADELELLWTQLWEKLTDSNRKLFLEVISEHIENGDIRAVNPLISQALVEHWLNIYPAKLEEIILKLDWTCLDINQVMRASKRHKLYRAQIYLNTQALNDYTVTLTELIPQLQQALDNGSEVPADLGNCLLVFISCCLAGRGYPVGDIPAEQIQHVKHEVLRCMTASRSANAQHEPATVTVSLPYPYLRALLQFDTRETLNVISLAFQEREFNGEQGQGQRKRIINILLQIMTPENATWSQIGCLLNFIAQQISQQCLPRDPQLLHTVLNYLATERIANESTRQHAERESAWHELLVNNCLDGISSDDEQLELAKRANCYYVVEYLLEKLQRYEHILDCYLVCKERHDTAFSYMERHIAKPERMIYAQLRQHLLQLLHINTAETSRIISQYYNAQLDELLETLEHTNNEQSVCRLLQDLHKREAPLLAKHYERLLELLCEQQAAPEIVLNLLQCKMVLACMQPQRALNIVSAHALPEACIYLHELLKQYAQAFELGLQMLQNATHIAQSEQRLQQISALCSRACKHNEQNSSLWLQLLREVLPRSDLKHVTKTLLHECSQHVDLQQLVQLIMQLQKMSGSFGDIKTLLLDMLSHARSEQRAMASNVQLLGKQMHVLFAEEQRKVRRGLFVTSLRCAICQHRLHNQLEHILLPGTCAHAIHENCAKEAYGNVLSDAADMHCQRCQHNLPRHMLISTMTLSTPITTIATNTTTTTTTITTTNINDTSQNMLAYVGNTVAPLLPLKATPLRYH